MALSDMLATVQRGSRREVDVSEESVLRHIGKMRELVAYWRAYPDRLVDYMCSLNPRNSFHLYFFQRFYLRVCMRHKYVYATFTRGFSKSFLAVLTKMIQAVLYPGAHLFVCGETKGQSAGILSDKVDEICRLIPAFADEIVWDTRGSTAKTQVSKDAVSYLFKNGSRIENLAAAESSRGKRYQSGLMEECAKMNGKLLNEVVIPTMNVERRVNGQVDPDEVLNRSQIYITSAGYKATFAYEKLIQMYCQMVVNPREAFIFGGDYRISAAEGLLNMDDVKETQADSTYDASSFEREFASVWSGTVEGSFFDPDKFDRCRDVEKAEWKYDPNVARGASRAVGGGYYVLGVDVGRFGRCTSEAVVLKVMPQPDGRSPIKKVVNIFTFDEEHFEMQSIQIKRLYEQYRCRAVLVDGNGLGTGLIDYLVKDQEDPDTGKMLYNFGVINTYEGDTERYKKFETENTVPNALYVVKMNVQSNSQLYTYTQSQLLSGRIHFLVPYNTAEATLVATKKGKMLSKSQRENHLRPFRQTDFLKNQILNLVEKENMGVVVLKQSNSRVKKDKFSALIYALLWCKMEEEKAASRRKTRLGDFVFFTPSHGPR